MTRVSTKYSHPFSNIVMVVLLFSAILLSFGVVNVSEASDQTPKDTNIYVAKYKHPTGAGTSVVISQDFTMDLNLDNSPRRTTASKSYYKLKNMKDSVKLSGTGYVSENWAPFLLPNKFIGMTIANSGKEDYYKYNYISYQSTSSFVVCFAGWIGSATTGAGTTADVITPKVTINVDDWESLLKNKK